MCLLIGKNPAVAQKPGIFGVGKNATPNCRDNPSSLKITTETEMAQIGGMVVGSAPGISPGAGFHCSEKQCNSAIHVFCVWHTFHYCC